MRKLLFVAFMFGFVAACGGGGGGAKGAPTAGDTAASAEPTPIDAAVTPPVEPPPAEPVAVAPPEEDAKNVIPADLPPFGKAATADRKKSDQLVADVLQSTMLGVGADGPIDPGIFGAAVDAVRADPGSPYARYALACVAQDDAASTAIFETLIAAKDCPACVDAVRNILRGNCPFGDSVRTLADKVTPSKQRAAAEAVAAAIGSSNGSKVAAFFKAAKTELIVNCYACDLEPGESKKKMSGAKLLKAVTVDVKQEMDDHGFGGIHGGLEMTCASDCCTVVSGMVQHNRDFLETICFAKGSDQVRSIRLQPGG